MSEFMFNVLALERPQEVLFLEGVWNYALRYYE